MNGIRTFRFFLRRISIFGLFALLFISCGKQMEVDDSQVFRFNRYENISSFDPAFASKQTNTWICNQMYNSLVTLDHDLKVVPDVAESWEMSNGGKTYRFLLKDNVFFHKHEAFGKDSTRAVTAHDFEYSFHRLEDEKVASPGKWVLAQIENYKAINDSIFEVNLKQAFPPFLGLMSMKYCSVVPKEIFEKGYDFEKNPIGTGPFQFKYFASNEKLILRKNEIYFEKDEKGESLPYLDAIAITFLPEKHSEFIQLVQSEADMLSDIHDSYARDLLNQEAGVSEKYSDKIEKLSAPYLITHYLCFNTKHSEATPKELRQALALSINKNLFIDYLRNGIGSSADGGFIPLGLEGHVPDAGFKFDLQRAKELVKEYEKTSEQKAEITLTTVKEHQGKLEFIQGQAQKAGIKININILTPSAVKEGRVNGKLQAFYAGWIADYPDGENFLALFDSKNHSPNGPNYSFYDNPEFDNLFYESVKETDKSKREKMYRKADSIMAQDMPIIPLFHDEATVFIRKNVKNFRTNPQKELNLKRVYKESK